MAYTLSDPQPGLEVAPGVPDCPLGNTISDVGGLM